MKKDRTKGWSMAYNEEIEARIKKIVSKWKDTGDKKMFGGVCHLLTGCCPNQPFALRQAQGERWCFEII